MENGVAVLIDAENVGSDLIPGVLRKVSGFGKVAKKSAYADWTILGKEWDQVLRKNGIEKVQQYSSGKGKNSSDIRLVIDAMDMLHSQVAYSVFVIVSSDSDFSPLVSRLREYGKTVVGFSEHGKCSETLRDCFDEFFYLDGCGDDVRQAGNAPSDAGLSDGIRGVILDVLDEADGLHKEKGWVNIGWLGKMIRKERPDFNVSAYGYRSLKEMLKDMFGESAVRNVTVRGVACCGCHVQSE